MVLVSLRRSNVGAGVQHRNPRQASRRDSQRYAWRVRLIWLYTDEVIVKQAVEYILAQPDGKKTAHYQVWPSKANSALQRTK
jgi:hypothetical protein